jgi:hypothetical protein
LIGFFLVHILWEKKTNWYLVTFAHMVGFMMKSMKVPVFFLQSPLIVDKPPFWWLEAPSSSNIHLCCVNLHSCYSSLKPPFFLLKPQFLWFTLWWTNRLLLKIAIEMVDLPSYKMVILHSYVAVYQRVINIVYIVYMEDPFMVDIPIKNCHFT